MDMYGNNNFNCMCITARHYRSMEEEINMVMKFELPHILDENELNNKINLYIATENREPCLFMSSKTADALISQQQYYGISDISDLTYSDKNVFKLCVFKGNRVYENNELKFGEIEIR